MKQLDDVPVKSAPLRGLTPAFLTSVVLAATAASMFSMPVNADEKDPNRADDGKPIVLKTQGSFAAGGTVLTNPGIFDPIALTPDGQTIHGDHAYVQYQIPVGARKYPIVMWHGGGQFTKTWETTPDGRDGFQNIFLRSGYAIYLLDQPHRGRAGRATLNGAVAAVPGPGPTGEQGIFIRFRVGIWPEYFPNAQFPRGEAALNQWWRQQTPDTAPASEAVVTTAVAAAFKGIGPAVLLTHSASGVYGWETAIQSRNVLAVYAYEPVTQVFPEGQVPDPEPSGPLGPVAGKAVPLSDFMMLTKIPIEIVWGDNFPIAGQPASPWPDIEIWQGRYVMAQKFVDLINANGGHAHMTHLPAIGVRGNSHFPMADLNNKEIAALLEAWLHQQGLDKE
jgi:hypothetical protein